MGTTKDTNIKGYCDTLNDDFAQMKTRIDDIRERLTKTYGADSDIFGVHNRHLCDMADYLDWKLHLLAKVCPFDWKGMDKGVETSVSVNQSERAAGPEISGGYMGG